MSNAAEENALEAARVGLCARCRHARRIVSQQTSVFYLCEFSAQDDRFAKYPRLPVIECPGYAKRIQGMPPARGVTPAER